MGLPRAFDIGSRRTAAPSRHRRSLGRRRRRPARIARPAVRGLERRALLTDLGILPHPYEGMGREQAERFFDERFLPPARVVASWDGDVAAGVAGTLGEDYRRAILDRVNAYRVLAGLPGVALDESLSGPAQQAALMMSANRTLSHSPDPGWIHYTAEGAASAGRSNLHLGRSGTAAIDSFIDEGPPSNAALGHRRWILYPPRAAMGVGDIPTSWQVDAYPGSTVLDVLGGGEVPRPADVVSWPPPGFLPGELVPDVWSFSMAGADFSSAEVTVSRDGVPLSVEVVTRDSLGYGDPTIGWSLPDGGDPGTETTSFDVTISGIRVTKASVTGTAKPGDVVGYSYRTQTFQPGTSPALDPPAIAFGADSVVVLGADGALEFDLVRLGALGARSQTFGLDIRGTGPDPFGIGSPGQPRPGVNIVTIAWAEGQRTAHLRFPVVDTSAIGESLTLDLFSLSDFQAIGRGDSPAPAPADSLRITFVEPPSHLGQNPGGSGRKIARADVDGDGRTDFVTFRIAGGSGMFELERSSDGARERLWLGFEGDSPFVGDFDGDGLADLGVFGVDPADGRAGARIRRSSDGTVVRTVFGGPSDLPVVGDFDGDGVDDLGVYGFNPNVGFSRFLILPSGGGPAIDRPFGGAQDLPMAGDFDGDGRDDLAVYGFSPVEGFSRFGILPSSGPSARSIPFGGKDDRPIPGDFDGDGTTDLAVYGFSPLNGFSRFGVVYSSGRPTLTRPFGGEDDRPIPGDFDGDGTTDLAVYGFSPLNGFSRFGVLPSGGSPARVASIGEPGAVGLPLFADTLPDRSSRVSSAEAIGTRTAVASQIASFPIALAALPDSSGTTNPPGRTRDRWPELPEVDSSQGV
ncbi:CAP domain-containing protein [Tautonia sociabilis]|uniref:SCP domain-containing protein n=1 Tax=Tautonia sociabilis TaxID=2080755 RepID=A0A432MNW8_9BACT|nr:CAP domain-containing protein [Tautonia sociabilis]RUL88768.1 hypothetical protein TsocGM_05265 [Tautonia sociabilis]